MDVHCDQDDPKLLVVSEDEPSRTLLNVRVCKDDGYQKQQGEHHFEPKPLFERDAMCTKLSLEGTETLIVWTESNGMDMALSFQEAEGCASIW